MIVNETTDARTGDRYAETIDVDARTCRLAINGETWEERPLSAEEIERYTPAPDARAELAARAAKATSVAALRAVLLDTLALLDG